MGVSEKWDLLTKPTSDSMRGRMLADEELSEEEFERLAHRIALEAHEDRLKLWETALVRFERIERFESRNAVLMHVELELRHCIRQLLQLHGKPLQHGTLRDHLYALDLVTPDGRLYIPPQSDAAEKP